MRIVSLQEFLKLPEGTVYAKVGDKTGDNTQHYFGETRIKADNRGERDWWSVGFTDNFVGAHDSSAWIDELDRAYAGEEITFEFETLDSDGLYEDHQKFAVFSEAEHQALIDRLSQALQARKSPEKQQS